MVSNKERKKTEKCDLRRLWRVQGCQDSPRARTTPLFDALGCVKPPNVMTKYAFLMEMFSQVAFSSLTDYDGNL